MLVQSSRIAVLAVAAMILAQALCPAHFMAAAQTGAIPPKQPSNCHLAVPQTPASSTPAPAEPAPSNSGQRCCASPHHPDAVPAARYNPTELIAVSTVRSTPLFSRIISSCPVKGPAALPASPGSLVLRI